MAILTLDGLLAGLKPPIGFTKATFTGEAAGQYHDLGMLAGLPGARTLGAPGMSGIAADNTLVGSMPWSDPATGNAYLAKLSVSVGANIVAITLFDLLWYQSGIAETTTTAQTVNSVAWPARSKDGTVNGDGVEIWMHCTTATTNSSAIANTTYGYTNQAGTAGRSAGLVMSWPATAVAGTMMAFALQAGDTGVRSVQSVTLGTSYVGGQVELFALRRIASASLVTATSGVNLDPFMVGMPQLFAGSSLYLMALLSGTAAGMVTGELAYAHG